MQIRLNDVRPQENSVLLDVTIIDGDTMFDTTFQAPLSVTVSETDFKAALKAKITAYRSLKAATARAVLHLGDTFDEADL